MSSAIRSLAFAIGGTLIFSLSVHAEPPVAPFYQLVASLAPTGKLGEVIKREKVSTSIKGAQAWRIAYISSDVGDRKTVSTALVVAPTGKAPAGWPADHGVGPWHHRYRTKLRPLADH